jgi:hypothetical protein
MVKIRLIVQTFALIFIFVGASGAFGLISLAGIGPYDVWVDTSTLEININENNRLDYSVEISDNIEADQSLIMYSMVFDSQDRIIIPSTRQTFNLPANDMIVFEQIMGSVPPSVSEVYRLEFAVWRIINGVNDPVTPGYKKDFRVGVTVIVSVRMNDRSFNGDFNPLPNDYPVLVGNSFTIEAFPDENYLFSGFLVDGVNNENNPLTVNPVDDMIIIPEFSLPDNLVVNIRVEPIGSGVVTPRSGLLSYPPGSTFTLNAEANTGFSFINFGIFPQGEDPYNSTETSITIQDLQTDMVIVAYFGESGPGEISVISRVSQDRGSVTPECDPCIYTQGESITFTAYANEGYKFNFWGILETGDTFDNNPLQVTSNQDFTIEAYFIRDYDDPDDPDNPTDPDMAGPVPLAMIGVGIASMVGSFFIPGARSVNIAGR